MEVSKKKNAVTAADLMQKLEQDPEYRAKTKEAEQRRHAAMEEHRRAEEPIVQELKQAGLSVESIDELRRSGRPDKLAIAVLLKWLPQVQDESVQESIVRALSVPWARPEAAPLLVAEFCTAKTPGLKWAIGNALEVVADEHVFAQIVELVRDKQHGKGREMLAVALGNMKNPAAVDVLIELLKDDEVAGHALMGLGKLKAENAKSHIEGFLNHPKPWVRKEARKALAQVNRPTGGTMS